MDADLLFDRYARSGDVETRNRLVEQHLLLARGLARRYRGRGVELDDLEQVARESLIRAIERFDPDLGVKFATFATRTVDGELKRYFRDRAWSVRVPRRYQDLGIAIRNAVDDLSKTLGRPPSVPELAHRVGAEVDEVLAAMEATEAFRAASIDQPAGGGGRNDPAATTVAESLGADDPAQSLVVDRATVTALLDRLPERERRIIELRFFADLSQREIADEVGMSQMHVSRLLRRALTTLRSIDDPPAADGSAGS